MASSGAENKPWTDLKEPIIDTVQLQWLAEKCKREARFTDKVEEIEELLSTYTAGDHHLGLAEVSKEMRKWAYEREREMSFDEGMDYRQTLQNHVARSIADTNDLDLVKLAKLRSFCNVPEFDIVLACYSESFRKKAKDLRTLLGPACNVSKIKPNITEPTLIPLNRDTAKIVKKIAGQTSDVYNFAWFCGQINAIDHQGLAPAAARSVLVNECYDGYKARMQHVYHVNEFLFTTAHVEKLIEMRLSNKISGDLVGLRAGIAQLLQDMNIGDE